MQLAVRKQDDAMVSSCIRTRKRTKKELSKLALQVHEISRFATSQQWGRSKEEEAEVAGIMRELTSVIGSTSQSLLMGVALKDLEGCIDMLESKVDRVYRSLVYCVFELYLYT
jgi:hypothetical protein